MIPNPFARKALLEPTRSFTGSTHPLREEVESRPQLYVQKVDPVDREAIRREERAAALQKGSLMDMAREDQMAEAEENRAKIAQFYVVQKRRLQSLAPRLVNAVVTARQLKRLLSSRGIGRAFATYEERAIQRMRFLQPAGRDRRVSILGNRVVMKDPAWKWIQAVGRARRELVQQRA